MKAPQSPGNDRAPEQANFPGKLGIIQRTLPAYRAPFFDTLAKNCTGGLSLFAGDPLPAEAIVVADELQSAQFHKAKNLHFLSPASPFYLCWQREVLGWLHAWQPDVLILEANPRYLSSPRAVSWMHLRGRPVLGWGLGVPEQTGLAGSVLGLQRRAFLRSLDGVIAYSQAGAGQYLSAGIPAERIFIAHNAVAGRPSGHFITRSLPSAGDRPVVLFVGRLQQRKRIDLLLQACAALPEPLQPRLLIVGDGPARSAFEQFSQQVYPSAEFLGGLYGEELASIYYAADLFVLPGTGGLAIQQAMAHGLPVIAAEADGTQGDLVRPESGWQVPPDDLESLRKALIEALSDVPHLRVMGREAYRIVSEDINLESMAASFVHAALKILQMGLRAK